MLKNCCVNRIKPAHHPVSPPLRKPVWLLPKPCRIFVFALAIWCLPFSVQADALGATDAAELAKLTEIIAQMTELLEKTQEHLDAQRRLTEMQERSFFRKARAYGKEVRRLVYQQERLEQVAGELRRDPFHIEDMQRDINLLRQEAERIDDGNSKQNLLQLADSLQLLGNTRWLAGTAETALAETTNSASGNSEDQLLAGIFYTLVEMNKAIGKEEVKEDMKETNARWFMQGSYSVFRQGYGGGYRDYENYED